MELQEKLQVFLELVQCSHHMDYWLYSPEGVLVRSTSETEHLLHLVFKKSECLAYMNNAISTAPLILTGRVDLHWIAVKEMQGDKVAACHVLGPYLAGNTQQNAVQYLRDAVHEMAPESWVEILTDSIQALSAVSLETACQYAVMLHRLVNGELLPATAVEHQPAPVPDLLSSVSDAKVPARMKDRMEVYLAERTLMQAIQEGDANAAASSALSAQKRVARVREYTGNALLDTKIACTTFVTICTRAAIEGGLTPSLAYPIGDRYIKQIFNATNQEHVIELKSRMYDDFVARVHRLRVNPSYSKPTQSCCDYIQLHPAEPLSIEMLAKRLGYAPYYLSAQFKKETGCSVSMYIKCARVERAKVLLASTDMNVESIWEAVGFSSRSVFGKAFRSIVGMTPREYREQNLLL